MIYPLAKLTGMEGKDGTVDVTFDTVSGEDKISLTTANEFTALKDIAEKIGGPAHSDGVIVIADDVASVYASSQITAVGAAG